MTWEINWTDEARKQLRKLDKPVQKKILNYLSERVLQADHPTAFGKPLQHNKYGLWRYRVEDTRVICQIQDGELVILVVAVGDRKVIYKNNITQEKGAGH